MPVGLTIVLRCLAAAALLAFVGAGVAQAQAPVSTVTLDPRPIGRPQLGVAADGAAVVAWPTFRGSYTSSIVVSARPAGGAFGAGRKLSTGEAQVPSGDVEVPSGFALAVGARDDTAVVWRQYVAMRGYPLLVARGRSARRLGTPVEIRPAHGRVDSSPAAAIDARGTLLVAWLRSSGRRGCGRVVMASTARRDGRLSAIRRVSGPCAKADQPQVALARNGLGAITWRAVSGGDPEAPRYSLHVRVVTNGSPGRERVVSPRPIWFGPAALAAGATDVLVAWREKRRTTRAGEARGRVLTATVRAGTIGPTVAASRSDQIQGDIYAAMNRANDAIVSWVQIGPGADSGDRVALRDAGRVAFGAPEPIGACAQATWQSGSGRGHLDTAARVALDQRGAAIATLRDTCDANIGVSATRRPVGGVWLPPIGLGMPGARDEQQLASLAADDAGEGVATWLALPGKRSFETGALRVSVYAP
jgi:hypothetical protein